jgi:hypothetical protein
MLQTLLTKLFSNFREDIKKDVQEIVADELKPLKDSLDKLEKIGYEDSQTKDIFLKIEKNISIIAQSFKS